jgi:putative ABC transport system permease protein
LLLITLRDLQWRRRRFAITIVGTAVVFALALTLAGMSHGFDVEAQSTVHRMGADSWLIGTGASGPFLGFAPIPTSDAAAVSRLPGIRAAGPVIYARKGLGTGSGAKDINVFGARAGSPGMPKVSSGRAPAAVGEAAVSTRLKGNHPIGSALEIAGNTYKVVGRVSSSTILAGIPIVYLTLPDAQHLAFGNTSSISTIAIVGKPAGSLPKGLTLVSNHAAVVDLERPLIEAHQAVTYIAILLFFVAALIVGSMVYLSALERQRDFAVLKATGLSNGSILAGLAIQAVIVSVGASLVALVLAVIMVPFFPLQVVITNVIRALLPAGGVVVGLLASGLAVRRATSVDPALAFGGP